MRFSIYMLKTIKIFTIGARPLFHGLRRRRIAVGLSNGAAI